MGSTLTMRLPGGFELPKAVCSYGYFLLAPNHWFPQKQALGRVLRTGSGHLIWTVVRQTGSDRLQIACDRRVDRRQAEDLRRQVGRMLRLDQDLEGWYRVHPAACRAGFGRLFRSPSLFEDIVKTMTSCNVTWSNTMRMNRLLCRHVGGGGFPTPRQLAGTRVDVLRRRCKVGYRANWMVTLARQVHRNRLDLEPMEDPTQSTEQIERWLRRIHGVGPYAAANLCQLLGRYDRLAIDTETYRHFRQEHGMSTRGNRKKLHQRIEQYYRPYAPYQFLAYWFDLWTAYQRRAGDAKSWTAAGEGVGLTASGGQST